MHSSKELQKNKFVILVTNNDNKFYLFPLFYVQMVRFYSYKIRDNIELILARPSITITVIKNKVYVTVTLNFDKNVYFKICMQIDFLTKICVNQIEGNKVQPISKYFKH